MTDNQLLTETQAAFCLQMSRSFLRQARIKGTGPKFVKLGSAVRYRKKDLDDWINQRLKKSTANL